MSTGMLVAGEKIMLEFLGGSILMHGLHLAAVVLCFVVADYVGGKVNGKTEKKSESASKAQTG